MRKLENAFTPVPSAVDACVDKALQEAQSMKIKHRKSMVAIVLAITLTLAGIGGAIAAGSGVLERLFAIGDTPNQDQLQMVHPVGSTWQAGDVRITLDENIYDGSLLALGLTVDAPKPVYLSAEGLWIDDELTDLYTGNQSFWSADPTQPTAEPGSFTMMFQDDQVRTGKHQAKLRVAILAPANGVRAFEMDWDDPDGAMDKMNREALTAIGEGLTPVRHNGVSNFMGGSAYMVLSGEQTFEYPDDGDPYHYNRDSVYYTAAANMTLIGEVMLEFPMECSTSTVNYRLVNADDLPFLVAVDECSIGTLSTHIMLRFYPAKPAETPNEVIEELMDKYHLDYLSPMLENGEYPDFQHFMNAFGMTGSMTTDENGEWCMNMNQRCGTLPDAPEVLLLTTGDWPGNTGITLRFERE